MPFKLGLTTSRAYLVIGSLLFSAAAHAQLTTYQEALKESRRLYYSGDKTGALTTIQKAVELAEKPEDKVGALMRVAQIFKENKNFLQARAAWQQVAVLDGATAESKTTALFFIAGSLLEDNKSEEARALFQQIVRSPNSDPKFYGLARVGYAGSFSNEKKNDDALRELASVVADEKVGFPSRAMAQDGRGEILKNQGQFTEAREAFQSALEFIDQGAKADSGLVTQKSAVYLGIVGTYKKQYDLARAKDEALKIFAPVMKQATEYRNALRYEKALPLYLSLDGIAPYLPSEFFFIVKTGEGEMLMFGKQWPEAREFFRQAVSAQIGAGGTEQWQGNVRLLQQMAARSLALSFKLQGQVENNAAAFAQARKSYAELLARPDLNAAVRADAESDMKQLPPAPETPSVAAAPATP